MSSLGSSWSLRADHVQYAGAPTVVGSFEPNRRLNLAESPREISSCRLQQNGARPTSRMGQVAGPSR